ncbi:MULTISPECIES: hypothetical protein [Streptomyces]|uniref:Uncharacterized protein n=1 Tax=Streptomyces prasinus TaxID=67345 RepID=A0ABX6AWA7_9ACTN|nr:MULTISPECIES: hypothetical protein [Streptomyces]QEV06754.1 hypothetical protein CP972_14775 [Streptomyces prasinus]
MTAVAVEIAPRRPLPGDGPTQTGQPYLTRPILEPVEPVTRITAVGDMDTVMDSAKCSCAAGDDNPH